MLSSGRPITVVHFISDLGVGGAEAALCRLVSGMTASPFQSLVVSLTDRGPMAERLEGMGAGVYALGMDQGRPTLHALCRAARLLRRIGPHLVCAWMYHANLVATAATCLARVRVPVLWGIRHTPYDLRREKRLTRLVIRLGARLSRSPVRIIYNSQVSASRHKQLGYCAERQVVIPNGFDTQRFRPSASARLHLRRSLGLSEEALLIGLVGRYHPVKDHGTFIRAAAALAHRCPDVQFVLVGRDLTETNSDLMRLICEKDLGRQVHLLGERSDIPQITAGFDIASLSSWGEGFPNVVGEAMACAVPCVVTDVGDSAWVVGETGLVVPSGNAHAMAEGWARLIHMGADGRARLGRAARDRVISRFALSETVRQYEQLYQEVLTQHTAQTESVS